MHHRNRRRNPAGAQRLALRRQQARRAHASRGRPRGRKRLAAGLSQPGGRAGRAGVRRRLVCAERRSQSLALQMPAFAESLAITDWTRKANGWRLRTRRDGGSRRRPRRCLWRDDAGAEGLCEQEPLSRRGAGAFRRHRFRALRRRRRRCAGPRARALRDDAVALHQPGKPGRCGGLRETAGRLLRERAHRRRGGRLHRCARARLRRQARPTPPKKTSSRAFAASS